MRGFGELAALAAVLWLSLAGVAAAQQPPDSYDLKLSPQELQVIEQGLLDLPLKVSGPVYSKVIDQVRAATKKSDPSAAAEK